MTAIAKLNIPDGCNSVEKIAAWAILTLVRHNPTMRVLEIDDETPVRVVSSSVLEAAGGTTRLLGRVSLELNAGYDISTLPLWEEVKDLSNTTLNAGYFKP